MKTKTFIFICLGIILVFLLIRADRYMDRHYNEPDPSPSKPDTVEIVKHDTVTIEKPVPVTKTVIDSILVPAGDTLTVHDTLFVVLERVQRVYSDSLYTAYVSGIDPSLDSLKLNIPVKTKIVTQEVVRKEYLPWSVGPSIGYGLGADGATFFVGATVTYNLLSLFHR